MSVHAGQVASAMAKTGAGVEAMVSLAREIDQMTRRMHAHTDELAKSLAG
jgi:methyl-accepting chemotaxis protein